MPEISTKPVLRWSGRQWSTLLGCALALVVSTTALSITFGIFLLPICKTFGWSREIVSSAFSIAFFANAFALPVIGQIVDRVSPRRTVIVGGLLLASATASLSLLTPSRILLAALFAIWGMVASTQTPMPYVKIISSWFNQGRGLAIGLVLTGSALGTALLPVGVQAIIAHSSWRHAFVVLAVVMVLVALPAQLFLIKWPPTVARQDAARKEESRSNSPVDTDEPLLGEALRTFSFWSIALAIFFVGCVVMGLQVHMFALLKDRGFGDSTAVLAVSVAGFSIIAGRLIAGLAVDYIRSDFVGAAFFAGPALALGLLWMSSGVIVPTIAAALIGMCSGGEVLIAATLVLKLFGHRAFGKIYSCVFFGFAMGCGVGPWVMARAFGQAKSYAPGLAILAGFSIVAGMLALAVGVLNGWSRKPQT